MDRSPETADADYAWLFNNKVFPDRNEVLANRPSQKQGRKYRPKADPMDRKAILIAKLSQTKNSKETGETRSLFELVIRILQKRMAEGSTRAANIYDKYFSRYHTAESMVQASYLVVASPMSAEEWIAEQEAKAERKNRIYNEVRQELGLQKQS